MHQAPDRFVALSRYCCNVGSYHVSRASDPSVAVAEDENIRRWVLNEDGVIVRAVATAVGAEGLSMLVEYFLRSESFLYAAKVESAAAAAAPGGMFGKDAHARVTAALALIEEHSLVTLEAQQLVS